MCGIIGYVGHENDAVDVLIDGLSALEYRGYDSAGIAVFDPKRELRVVKDVGRVSRLKESTACIKGSHCGVGHTRWATHGAPSKENSHPHGTERVQIVHNGIIENYACIKRELEELGYEFYSQTDTEVAAKLIDYYYKQRGERYAALSCAVSRLEGSYALGVVFADAPEVIYAARKDQPLLIGIGKKEAYIASDVTAFLKRTREYYSLEDGDIAVVESDETRIYADGRDITEQRERRIAKWDIEAAEKGGYDHFMLKEIFEEPEAVAKTLGARIHDGLPSLADEGFDEDILKDAKRLYIVACGTAMHAGLIGKAMLEYLACLPTSVEIASEFRYDASLIGEGDLVMIISQSGETADSLAALRLAKKKGAKTLAIVNVIGSSIAKEADGVLYTWAGPEIAVASTKAYTVQTALLCLIALRCAFLRGHIDIRRARKLTHELVFDATHAISRVLERTDELKALAQKLAESEDLFFIGRKTDYYLACEGSLKLKEISYIHSEAYAAGELKHGTISLITDGTPVIAIATVSELYGKLGSNMEEVASRGADVMLITNSSELAEQVDSAFLLPRISEYFEFLPLATALQLLAYHTAVLRGCDVDKPRNLAKSVTVE